MAKQLQIKLIRGTAGKPEWTKKTIKGLGLRKTNSVVVRQDTPAIRGMIFKVIHCLEVKVL